MKKLLAGFLVAASIMAISPAYAESFQGPYVGVEAGWSRDSIGHANTDVGRIDLNEHGDAFAGGILAGYDYKIAPSIVAGVEASFDIGADDIAGNGATVIDPNYTFDASARVGYLVTPQTLLYVRGGYENTRARVVNQGVSGHDTFDGWSVGAGVERDIMEHVSARLEYRYSDLGSRGSDFDRHQVMTALSYHF